MKRGRLATIGLALVCVLAATYFALHWHEASRVRQANQLGRSRDWAAAARVASGVQRTPERAPARLAEARALRASGQYRAADRAFARAATEDPNNWIVYRDWGPVIDHLRDRKRAAVTYAHALALNPRATFSFSTVVARRRSARR